MKRSILFFFWIFLLLFSLASFYVSYSAYLEERERHITENISTFFMNYPNKAIVPLPYPELTIIKIKEDGKIYASANFAAPMDYENFIKLIKRGNTKTVEIYIRKPSFDDFTFFLFANPIFIAMNLFLFVIYLAFYYLMIKELEKPIPVKIERESYQEQEEVSLLKQELIKRLKALKILIHTERVLGKEAIEKAKNLIDEMLKKLENR